MMPTLSSEAAMREPSPTPSPGIRFGGAERRTSRRHTNLATHHRLVAAVGDDFVLAKIRNISPEGISLILNRPVEAGTMLSVDLIDTKSNRFSRTLQVRVLYSVEHPSGDWILGGTFASKLTDEELRTFLR
jgi:hypothetical protein